MNSRRSLKLFFNIGLLLTLVLGASHIQALPISDGAKTEEPMEQNSKEVHSFSPKNNIRTILPIIGIALIPFVLFIPFAWSFVMGFPILWISLLALIGVATLLQIILVIWNLFYLANTSKAGFGPDLRGLGLGIFGSLLTWFASIGGLITLIWGLIAGVNLLWIMGASLLLIALITFIILRTHPDV